MPMPMVPSSYEEFASKAKNFVAKAKEAGKSSIAIANTLELMLGMYQNASKDYNTELKDVDNDGVMELVDMKTGEIVKKFSDATGDINSGLSDIESQTNPADIELPGADPVTSSSVVSTNVDLKLPSKSIDQYADDIEKMNQRRKAGDTSVPTPSTKDLGVQDKQAFLEDVDPGKMGIKTPNFSQQVQELQPSTDLYLPMTRFKNGY